MSSWFNYPSWELMKKLFYNEGELPYRPPDYNVLLLEDEGFVKIASSKIIMTRKGLLYYLEKAEEKFIEDHKDERAL